MFRVLKSGLVTVDHENTITIDVSEPFENDEEYVWKEEEEQKEEVIAAHHAKASSDVLAQAKREAEMIILVAQQDADSILRNAQESAEALAAQSAEEGYKEGYENGYAEGVKSAEALKKEASKTLDDAKRKREQMINSVEGDMVELVVAISNRLLMDTANINPKVVMALIKQGLSMSTASGNIVIRVSPDDYDTVVENKDDIAKQVEASSKLEIIKDLSLNPSDCIIETPYGDIDCSLDGQFKTLSEHIYYIFNNNGAQTPADE